MEEENEPSTRGRVLVLAEDARVRRSLRAHLARLGHACSEFLDVDEVIQSQSSDANRPAAVFLNCPDERVAEMIEKLSARLDPVPLIIVSADTDPQRVVELVHLGAAAVLPTPFDKKSLQSALEMAAQRAKKEAPARPGPTTPDAPRSFVSVSASMRPVVDMARRVADSDITVLIRGESGVGKEVIARYVHSCSGRATGPFVKVNCAALPEELLESELFGYQKGAFTGASTDKPGKFEVANDGTIFLDEITETSGRLQAKLLHALQDKKMTRLGGTREVELNVRILAATNADLELAVTEGRFREDLYFRLKVIELHVPPLRERREEIPVLLDLFLRRFSKQYRRPIPDLSERLLNLLTNHWWFGNVRELENLTKRLVILGDETPVVQELLSRAQFGGRASKPVPTARPPSYETPPSEPILDLKKVGERAALAAEKSLILSTLEKTRWNRMRASRILGVSYKTLLTKMKKCGLTDG